MKILTLAEVEALRDFTPGPWLLPEDAPDRNALVDFSDPEAVAEWEANLVPVQFELDEYYAEYGHVGPAMLSGSGPVKDDPDARLIAAAPALHATCLHLFAEVARLTAERERLLAWLSKIEGGDNPSGGVEDLRQWAWRAGMGSEVDDG